MAWRSPDSESLDADERARVRGLQIAVMAQKECASCGKSQPVYRFPHYGAALCEACTNAPLEDWWAQRTAQLAAAS